MKKIADSLEKVLKLVVIVLLSAMTIIVVLGIFSRYLLYISIPWTEELSRYLMIWTGFLAFGLAYRRRELIAVKVFTNTLSPKLLKLTVVISDLACTIFLVIIIFYGTRLCLINSYQVSPAARIPMSYVYAAIPIGCLIFLIFIAETFLGYLKKTGSN